MLDYAYDNLGLVERALGNTVAAASLYRKAVAVTVAHRVRNRAPALTDLADALCAQGDYGRAAALLNRARPLMVTTYPDDPWRPAWVDDVRGECLMRAGRRREGAALILASGKPLLARWPADSYYGAIVAERVQRARAVAPGGG